MDEAEKKKGLWNFAKTTVTHWLGEEPFQLAAALAYFTLFSLAPLLIVLTGIVGLLAGESTAQNYILSSLSGMIGEQSARALQEMMQKAGRENGGLLATIIGIALLLVGAAGVVGQLQSSLNKIWGVEAKTQKGIWPILRARFVSYAMLLAIGFLLLVSLVVTTAVSALSDYLSGLLPGIESVWPAIDIAISFGFTTALFAMIYKFLPDARITWRDVWVGAALTAFFFSVGKLAIGLYLGKSAVASSYGAAGSLVTVLLWIYYSSVIFFFGAEVTRVFATQYGAGLRPTAIAETTKNGEKKEKQIEQQNPATVQR
ncbi:MAG TPA: YihY/virulence factor BrkB family protein [Verrucomicrobiae bacterium]|nr:YihY/virulence factor BrkB family protein [Verrucomicrobiae bacterium]